MNVLGAKMPPLFMSLYLDFLIAFQNSLLKMASALHRLILLHSVRSDILH